MTSEDLHVAIIMDGNGRWAQRRGLPRPAGHRAGAKAVRGCVEGAARLGVGTLTLYAFSSANWSRPVAEIRNLTALLTRYLLSETPRCLSNNIRLQVIGRRDRLAPGLVNAVEDAESQTQACHGMRLRLAVDYSAQHAIATTAANLPRDSLSIDAFSRAIGTTIHSPGRMQPVDLLLRTGGEQRLSDFLLWECAYAELVFIPTLWPDFREAELRRALLEYAQRERRFGGVSAATGS